MIRQMIGSLLDTVDRRTLSTVYSGVSLNTDAVRAALLSRGLYFVGAPEAEGSLEASARWVIGQSAIKAATFGGLMGVGGAASIPTEAVGLVIAVLRMGQRLAVVYGFELESDRGQMALSQAMAAAFDVKLPRGGSLGLRVSSLRLFQSSPTLSSDGLLIQAIMRRAAWLVGGRFFRVVPVLSAGLGATAARRRVCVMGEVMQRVFIGLSGERVSSSAEMVDVVVL